MKKELEFIVVGLVIGVAAYLIIHDAKTKKMNTPGKKEAVAKEQSADSAPAAKMPHAYTSDMEYDSYKASTVGTMTDRHTEAAKIMKDAVEIISKRSEVPEKDLELNGISNELDSLLSEE